MARVFTRRSAPPARAIDGAGKPTAKIPTITGDDAKKPSDADLSKAVTEKPKHAGVAKSLTPISKDGRFLSANCRRNRSGCSLCAPAWPLLTPPWGWRKARGAS
jgi:hypothetical protein